MATPRRVSTEAARAMCALRYQDRLEDYRWLTRQEHLTIEQAAERMRISYRTAQRYEARLKAGQGAG